jgi:hypothetical protein
MTNTRAAYKEGRRLVLIDIENLAATPSPTTREVQMVIGALRDAIPGFDQAQRIVACSHHAAATVAFAFPSARQLWRSGQDGADLALLDVLGGEHVEERFSQVTICSGDGIFAASTARLAVSGVDVSVVSLQGHLSTRLELAARTVVLLPLIEELALTGRAS